MLREPEVAPLATRLGYLPEMTLLQRDHLEVDVRRAVRWARTAEALRLGQDAGVPARTDRAFALALADVVAATGRCGGRGCPGRVRAGATRATGAGARRRLRELLYESRTLPDG